jgi:hypothetical protein
MTFVSGVHFGVYSSGAAAHSSLIKCGVVFYNITLSGRNVLKHGIETRLRQERQAGNVGFPWCDAELIADLNLLYSLLDPSFTLPGGYPRVSGVHAWLEETFPRKGAVQLGLRYSPLTLTAAWYFARYYA